jgi:pantetheine-phosphate adenylyltransferase
VTLGHLDVIRRASGLWDEVVVAVLHNPAKKGTFSAQERRELVAEACADLPGVRVETFANRLLVDVCRDVGASAIVKGLRGGTAFAYELPSALVNRHLTGIETVSLPGDPSLEHISSSLVKEVARHGGDITGLVGDRVRDALLERLGRQ